MTYEEWLLLQQQQQGAQPPPPGPAPTGVAAYEQEAYRASEPPPPGPAPAPAPPPVAEPTYAQYEQAPPPAGPAPAPAPSAGNAQQAAYDAQQYEAGNAYSTGTGEIGQRPPSTAWGAPAGDAQPFGAATAFAPGPGAAPKDVAAAPNPQAFQEAARPLQPALPAPDAPPPDPASAYRPGNVSRGRAHADQQVLPGTGGARTLQPDRAQGRFVPAVPPEPAAGAPPAIRPILQDGQTWIGEFRRTQEDITRATNTPEAIAEATASAANRTVLAERGIERTPVANDREKPSDLRLNSGLGHGVWDEQAGTTEPARTDGKTVSGEKTDREVGIERRVARLTGEGADATMDLPTTRREVADRLALDRYGVPFDQLHEDEKLDVRRAMGQEEATPRPNVFDPIGGAIGGAAGAAGRVKDEGIAPALDAAGQFLRENAVVDEDAPPVDIPARSGLRAAGGWEASPLQRALRDEQNALRREEATKDQLQPVTRTPSGLAQVPVGLPGGLDTLLSPEGYGLVARTNKAANEQLVGGQPVFVSSGNIVQQGLSVLSQAQMDALRITYDQWLRTPAGREAVAANYDPAAGTADPNAVIQAWADDLGFWSYLWEATRADPTIAAEAIGGLASLGFKTGASLAAKTGHQGLSKGLALAGRAAEGTDLIGEGVGFVAGKAANRLRPLVDTAATRVGREEAAARMTVDQMLAERQRGISGAAATAPSPPDPGPPAAPGTNVLPANPPAGSPPGVVARRPPGVSPSRQGGAAALPAQPAAGAGTVTLPAPDGSTVTAVPGPYGSLRTEDGALRVRSDNRRAREGLTRNTWVLEERGPDGSFRQVGDYPDNGAATRALAARAAGRSMPNAAGPGAGSPAVPGAGSAPAAETPPPPTGSAVGTTASGRGDATLEDWRRNGVPTPSGRRVPVAVDEGVGGVPRGLSFGDGRVTVAVEETGWSIYRDGEYVDTVTRDRSGSGRDRAVREAARLADELANGPAPALTTLGGAPAVPRAGAPSVPGVPVGGGTAMPSGMVRRTRDQERAYLAAIAGTPSGRDALIAMEERLQQAAAAAADPAVGQRIGDAVNMMGVGIGQSANQFYTKRGEAYLQLKALADDLRGADDALADEIDRFLADAGVEFRDAPIGETYAPGSDNGWVISSNAPGDSVIARTTTPQVWVNGELIQNGEVGLGPAARNALVARDVAPGATISPNGGGSTTPAVPARPAPAGNATGGSAALDGQPLSANRYGPAAPTVRYDAPEDVPTHTFLPSETPQGTRTVVGYGDDNRIQIDVREYPGQPPVYFLIDNGPRGRRQIGVFRNMDEADRAARDEAADWSTGIPIANRRNGVLDADGSPWAAPDAASVPPRGPDGMAPGDGRMNRGPRSPDALGILPYYDNAFTNIATGLRYHGQRMRTPLDDSLGDGARALESPYRPGSFSDRYRFDFGEEGERVLSQTVTVADGRVKREMAAGDAAEHYLDKLRRTIPIAKKLVDNQGRLNPDARLTPEERALFEHYAKLFNLQAEAENRGFNDAAEFLAAMANDAPAQHQVVAARVATDVGVKLGARRADGTPFKTDIWGNFRTKDTLSGKILDAIDSYLGFRRTMSLFFVTKGPAYALTQFIGNNATLAAARPSALRYYNDPHGFWMTLKAGSDPGKKAMSDPHREEWGLSGNPWVRNTAPVWLNERPSGGMATQRGRGATAELKSQSGGLVGRIFAPKALRDFAASLDQHMREALWLDVMMQRAPTAARQWREESAVWLRQAVEARRARPGTQFPPDVEAQVLRVVDNLRGPTGRDRFSSSAVRDALDGLYDELFVGTNAPVPTRGEWRNVSDRLARDWQQKLRAVDKEAVDEVKRVAFPFEETRFDSVARRVFMFHYWASRATRLYATEAIKKPYLLTGYVRLVEEMDRELRQSGQLQPWQEGYVNFMKSPTGVVAALAPMAFFGSWWTGNWVTDGRLGLGSAGPSSNKTLTPLGRFFTDTPGESLMFNPLFGDPLTAAGFMGQDAGYTGLLGIESAVLRPLEDLLNALNQSGVFGDKTQPGLITLPNPETLLFNWLAPLASMRTSHLGPDVAQYVAPKDDNAFDKQQLSAAFFQVIANAHPQNDPELVQTILAANPGVRPGSQAWEEAYKRHLDGIAAVELAKGPDSEYHKAAMNLWLEQRTTGALSFLPGVLGDVLGPASRYLLPGPLVQTAAQADVRRNRLTEKQIELEGVTNPNDPAGAERLVQQAYDENAMIWADHQRVGPLSTAPGGVGFARGTVELRAENVGTPEQRAVHEAYTAIRYPDNASIQPFTLNGRTITREMLVAMPQDERTLIAKEWLYSRYPGNQGQELLDGYYAAQDEFLAANPDYAGQKELARRAREFAGGPVAFVDALRAENPEFDRQMRLIETSDPGNLDKYVAPVLFGDGYWWLTGQRAELSDADNEAPAAFNQPLIPGLPPGTSLQSAAQQRAEEEAATSGYAAYQADVEGDFATIAQMQAEMPPEVYAVWLANATNGDAKDTYLPNEWYEYAKGKFVNEATGQSYAYPAGDVADYLTYAAGTDAPLGFEDWRAERERQEIVSGVALADLRERNAEEAVATGAAPAVADKASLVGKTSVAPQPAQPDASTGYVIDAPGTVNFRAQPGLGAGGILATLPVGTAVTPLETARDAEGTSWTLVALPDGSRGWVLTGYVGRAR